MPGYLNVRAFQKAQAKIESVRGTAETTMTRWLTVLQNGGITWTYGRDRSDEPETLRSFQDLRDTVLMMEKCTVKIEARLSFEEVIWWYQMAIKGGALSGTTDGGSPAAYTYSISATDTADDLSTFTLKLGDGETAYKFSRCAVNQMTISCNPDSGGNPTWRMSADILAIFAGTTTFDSPADITRTMISSYGGKIYLDTSSSIGTTALTQWRNWSLTINNNIEEKFFGDTPIITGGGLAAAADFGRGGQRITGDFTVEHRNTAASGPTSETLFTNMRSNTAYKLRFEKEATEVAQIHGTPATYYRARIDLPQIKLNSPSESYAGNNKVFTYAFVAEKPSGASAIQTATVIAASTVTA